ncbi:Crp/Fnr family transcriptional regulator [uncultured Mitsuokella sp.]|uniref:Crp/Fnr family transcriptional regulator n=1 Tax=uncultured Mitsuokella sp. TaxID=453120 RepID=UPI00259712BB|nr:Crp/Fnr family transcriptional regulator [uncultured Mitsuokella sp.]
MTVHAPAPCRSCQWDCLKTVDFLAGMPPEKRDELLGRSVRLELSKGAYLFHAGDPCDAIYIVHKGRVKLCVCDQNGQERIAGIFMEHDVMWEGVLVPDSRYSTSAICMTDVECCRLSRRDFEKAIQEPETALRIIGMLSKKLHDANRRNLLKSIADPKARVAGLLLYRYRRQASDVITMRLNEMAGSLALRPETISRKLKELEREGYVKKTGQSSIQVLAPERLMELVSY